MTTPQLGIAELASAQSQPEVIVNAALRTLEAALQLCVIDKDLTAPPGSPALTARYIVGAAPTGAWANHATHIAYIQNASWYFLTPVEGWLAYVQDEDALYKFDGSAWTLFAAGGGGSFTVEDVGGSPAVQYASVTKLQFSGQTVTQPEAGTVRVAGSSSGAAAHGTQSALTISANAITIDHSLGADFTVDLTANVNTVTHSNVTSGQTNWFSLRVKQDGTGGRTFTPPASWVYPSGVSAYTASSGASDVDLVQGITYDNGTTWLISYEKDYA